MKQLVRRTWKRDGSQNLFPLYLAVMTLKQLAFRGREDPRAYLERGEKLETRHAWYAMASVEGAKP